VARLRKRRLTQILAAIGFNLDLPSLLKGHISQAKTKGICVPVLNCYSCPAAIGACPIGSLQNSLDSLRYNLNLGQKKLGLYVVGSLGLVGVIGGRLPCGWICPFGWLQELIYKIPIQKLKIPACLTYLRYAVLLILVILLPLLLVDSLGLGSPWFCKLVCPAGTLEAGVVLALINPGLRSQLGFLFAWKVSLLVLFLVWMALSQRPFCRTICPLGTILGFFNRISAFEIKVDLDNCLVCNACQRACPVDIKIYENPASSQCVRCLQCQEICPTGCITSGFWLGRKADERKTDHRLPKA